MAGNSFTVKVDGAKELRRAVKKSGGDLKDLKAVHRDVGQVVISALDVPVRTGKLRASIQSQPTGTKARVGSSLPYAGPIHWGSPSRNLAPNPFISAAAVSTESTWTDLYLKETQKIMDEVQAST